MKPTLITLRTPLSDTDGVGAGRGHAVRLGHAQPWHQPERYLAVQSRVELPRTDGIGG